MDRGGLIKFKSYKMKNNIKLNRLRYKLQDGNKAVMTFAENDRRNLLFFYSELFLLGIMMGLIV